MVNYKCIRCGYENNDKSKMNTHFNRKTVCKPILSNIDLDEYKQKILNREIINTQNISHKNYTKSHPKSANSKKNHTNSHKNHTILQKNDIILCNNNVSNKVYECKYCNKQYSRKDSLNRHYKICQEKDTDDKCKQDMMDLVSKLNEQLELKDKQLHEELKKRDKQIDDQTKQINELIKKAGITQNIQNIQNNIKILAYKNTDLSHLTEKDYMYCLNRSNMCIPNLIKKIHFDPKKPENHNVYISNIKNKYIMIYDGNKWNLNDQDEAIDDIIDTNEFVLEQKLEEWIENGKDYPEIMKKFNRYLEKKEKDEVINKIKNEIKLILYNNRKVINDQIDI